MNLSPSDFFKTSLETAEDIARHEKQENAYDALSAGADGTQLEAIKKNQPAVYSRWCQDQSEKMYDL